MSAVSRPPDDRAHQYLQGDRLDPDLWADGYRVCEQGDAVRLMVLRHWSEEGCCCTLVLRRKYGLVGESTA